MSFAPSRRVLKRAAALAGVSALFAGLVATAPVYAEDAASVDLSVSVPAHDRDGKLPVVGLPFDGGTKELRVDVRNGVGAGASATGVTLSFQLPAANDAGSVTLSSAAPASCVVDADGAGSCQLNDLKPGSIANLQLFTVHSTVADRNDQRRIGRVSLSVKADQADRDESDNAYRFVVTVRKRAGLDLAAWVRQDDLVVRPGETGELTGADYHFTNDSATPARGLYWSLLLPQHVHATSLPKGCEHGTPFEDGSMTWESVECELDNLELGGHDVFNPPAIGYRVDADAPARARLDGTVIVNGVALAPANPEVPEQAEEFTTATLALSTPEVSDAQVKKYLDEHPGNVTDNNAEFAVFTYADTADLAVALDVPDAKVGGESKVTATITNNGPWAVDKGVTLEIVAPTGTTNLHSSKECEVAGNVLTCTLDKAIASGASVTYTFSLRVDSDTVGDDGKVTVHSTQPDPVTANNTAALKVTVLAGEPTASPSATSTTPGGGLPTTGTSLTIMGVAAAALLAAGAVFVVIARRRRTTTTDVE